MSCARLSCQPGTAARENRFAPVYGPSLVVATLAAMQEATDSAALEALAATVIQATFRMHRARVAFNRTRCCVVKLQSVCRGHAQRLRTRRLLAQEEERHQLAVFHYYATRIQSCFRGYASRKNKDDFYARKEYINMVTQRSNEVLAQSAVMNAELAMLVRLRGTVADHAAYTRATEQSHYLLSTAAIDGVYRPPAPPAAAALTTGVVDGNDGAEADFVKDAEGRRVESPPQETLGFSGSKRTTFGTDVEADVRANAAAARRPVLARELAANAATKVVTGAAATLTPGTTLGDGVGAGVAAISGGLTVGGATEEQVRRDRHVRRARYGQSVRASHYPTSGAGHWAAPAVAAAATAASEPAEGDCQRGFAASAPAAVGATVASRSVGRGAEAGALPPIRPSRRQVNGKGAGPLSSSMHVLAREDSSAAPGIGALSSSCPAVPWENVDALPPSQPPPGGTKRTRPSGQIRADGTARGGHPAPEKGARKALAVSSRHKAFQIPPHDCRDHLVGQQEPGAAAQRAASSAAPEKPLYDREQASLQRTVDTQVRQALHGKATFKV